MEGHSRGLIGMDAQICTSLLFPPAEILPASPQNALIISKIPKEYHLCPENEFYGGKKCRNGFPLMTFTSFIM